MAVYQGLEFLWTFPFARESMTSNGVWVLLRTNRLAMLKSWEPKAKTAGGAVEIGTS